MRFLVYGVVVSLCLVLPSALLLWLWRSRAASRVHLLSLIALIAVVQVVLTFSSLGAWYAVGGFWPAIFAAAFAAIVFFRVRRGLPRAWLPRRWSKEFFLTAANLVHAAFWCSLLPLLWLARAYEGEPLELSSPLRGGTYYVMGGGANASVNHHAFIRDQRYALDLIELNGLGVRAAGLSPDDLNDYTVFGTRVVAPCDGEVVFVEDGLPDRPLMDPDLQNPLGNHVVIFCGGTAWSSPTSRAARSRSRSEIGSRREHSWETSGTRGRRWSPISTSTRCVAGTPTHEGKQSRCGSTAGF